jgi:Ulp1 family protease
MLHFILYSTLSPQQYNTIQWTGRYIQQYNYSNVERWLKRQLKGVSKEGLFACDRVIVPINLPNGKHWAVICVYVKQHRLQYFDSLHWDGGTYLNVMKRY